MAIEKVFMVERRGPVDVGGQTVERDASPAEGLATIVHPTVCAQSQIGMKSLLIPLAVLFGLSAFGCSTVNSRVASAPAIMQASPEEVRRQIQAGEVAVGFTRDQVRLALGDPNGVTNRVSARGEEEVWNYQRRGPWLRLGVGVGVASGSRSGGVGVGVGVGAREEEPRIRVIMVDGGVTAVERARKS